MVTIPYTASFSPSQYAVITGDLTPRVLNDHWLVHFDNGALCFLRGGECWYRVRFGDAGGRHVVTRAEIFRTTDELVDHDVRLLDFMIRVGLLEEAIDYDETVGRRPESREVPARREPSLLVRLGRIFGARHR